MCLRIWARKLYLCATPDYLEKHGVPSDINDLKYHACIQGTADVWHFIVDDKLVDFRPKGPLRVNSGTAVADAALASRSEERRVGKEGVSTCRSRWWPYH